MDVELLIKESIGENNASTRYYAKLVREAHNKYCSLDSADLRHHQNRINYETRLFGESFRTKAGLFIIEKILSERAIS